ARAEQIRYAVLRDGLALVAAGLLCGLASAAVLSHVSRALLYRVGPLDPPTYGMVAGGLLLVALVAGRGPARRARLLAPPEGDSSECPGDGAPAIAERWCSSHTATRSRAGGSSTWRSRGRTRYSMRSLDEPPRVPAPRRSRERPGGPRPRGVDRGPSPLRESTRGGRECSSPRRVERVCL